MLGWCVIRLRLVLVGRLLDILGSGCGVSFGSLVGEILISEVNVVRWICLELEIVVCILCVVVSCVCVCDVLFGRLMFWCICSLVILVRCFCMVSVWLVSVRCVWLVC